MRVVTVEDIPPKLDGWNVLGSIAFESVAIINGVCRSGPVAVNIRGLLESLRQARP